MTVVADLDAEDLTALAHGHLDDLRSSLDGLAEIAEHLTDRDSLAAVLYEMHALIVGWSAKGQPAKARLVLDQYKAALLSEAGERTFDVPTIGRFEVKKNTKRSGWRYDELIPAIVAAGQRERRIISPEDGEVESEGHAVARAMRDCLSLSGGKVTGLRARSIDPDEYAISEDGGYDIQLPPPPSMPMPRDDESEAAA